MGATEDQLKHDAELQRARMGDTLEAIGDRLSPERMVERRKAAVGQTFRNMKESVMGSPGYQEPATERLRAQAGSARDAATSALHNATDLHLTAGAPPLLRIDGKHNPLDEPAQDGPHVERLVLGQLDGERRESVHRDKEIDISF